MSSTCMYDLQARQAMHTIYEHIEQFACALVSYIHASMRLTRE